MNTFRNTLLFLTVSVLGFASAVHAEDVDIYSAGAESIGVPNVLFVMDTGANFSNSAAIPCTAYAAGGAPSLGDTAGGVEQCALVDTISALPDSAVNIGILVNNNNNFGTDTRAPGDAAFHETCQGTFGGCVVRKLTLMDAPAKANLIKFIKSWTLSGNNSATEFNVKSGGDRTANTMQEAWAYYNGKVGMSGKDYSTSIINPGCQKNFVIYIGNSLNNAGGPADGGNESPFNGTYGLTSAQVKASAEQKAKISETVNFTTKELPTRKVCGVTSIAAGTSASNWSENWADEWARLMFEQDGSTLKDGGQNITTYTIGVINNTGDNTCKPDYPALLTTMAKYGGGKYFEASNASDVARALQAILNEIQAVNSVFASASLPVSVNAQGTYLNQVFLGMFRPDEKANPRWVGNLKQYQFIINTNNELVLGDANKKLAITSGGTGFIAPEAVSFWTTDSAAKPDGLVSGGFFKNVANPPSHDHYDSADGELVERGGAAQRLRIENLNANFAAGTDPRRLYTYCPSGTCVPALKDPKNAFTTGNTLIPPSAFGDSSNVVIDSIVRTGSSALVTTVGNHGFSAGSSVTISNVTPNDYNGPQTVVNPVGKTFTITGLKDYPSITSTRSYVVSGTSATSNLTKIQRTTSTTGTNTATATATSVSNQFSSGNVTIVSAVAGTDAAFVGTKAITSSTATSFNFDVNVYPPLTALNTYRAVYVPRTIAISAIKSAASKTITVTTAAPHGLHDKQGIIISGVVPSQLNGIGTIGYVNATTFTTSWKTPDASVVGTTMGNVVPSTVAVTLSGITRTGNGNGSGGVATTANVASHTAANGWFADGDKINITTNGTSPNEDGYSVSAAVVSNCNANCTSFRYSINTSPAASVVSVIPGDLTAEASSTSTVTIPVAGIKRVGDLATMTGLNSSFFGSSTIGATKVVNISVLPGETLLDSEKAYVGTGQWTLRCSVANCTEATFTLPPASLEPGVASGPHMQVTGAGSPPDKDTLIRWVRGEDNFGDEKGPGSPVTVRPSIHGDVLHSRPVVINYGDNRGLVVFYGDNGGVFHAVNGSQELPITKTKGGADLTPAIVAGGELWGLVLPDHFRKLNRQRLNSPELRLPSTLLASAAPKDYFVDGSTGAYQELDADGKISKAVLYLTMRRGGNFIYALDVTEPTDPKVLWKINASEDDFTELGQTWSRPRLTLVKGYANPVLVFGAGYDPGEDSEPPTPGYLTGTGIFVVDAATGALVWKAVGVGAGASSRCADSLGSVISANSNTKARCDVKGMNWAIPADISFVDRDNDGKTDRFYAADLGGNVWRVDLEPSTGNGNALSTAPYVSPQEWKVSLLANVGFDSGSPTPRKFFFPPNVVNVGPTLISPATSTKSYDLVLLGSGDREHPLKLPDPADPTDETKVLPSSSYSVQNRFYALKDFATGKDAIGTPILSTDLVNATTDGYNDESKKAYSDANSNATDKGFYINFGVGEKAVNASTTVRGTSFFGTNAPAALKANQCSNLGEAKGYAVDPFAGSFKATTFDGGGFPPTPTTGIVTIETKDTDGKVISSEKRSFCVGCGGGSGSDSKSALGAAEIKKLVPKQPRRTYWYKR